MEPYLRLIDTNAQGRYDVTPLFGNYEAFSALVAELARHFDKDSFDLVRAGRVVARIRRMHWDLFPAVVVPAPPDPGRPASSR